MKSLRQLLRRRNRSPRADQSSPGRPGPRNRRGETMRRLSTQALEQRQLLAADFEPAHNYANGYDVNQDWQITPSDALGVIHYLSTTHGQGELTFASLDEDPFLGRKVDVNADGQVTPSDALSVINALAEGETIMPVMEFLLTARDADDNLLPETDGVIQVEQGLENSFFLEVSYNDLRGEIDALGAFSIYPDVGVNLGGVLKPVLREGQIIAVSREFRYANSGNMTIGMEGSSVTVDIPFDELQTRRLRTIMNEVLEDDFGLDPSFFDVSAPSYLNPAESDIGVEIFYPGADGNADVPDLIITNDFGNFDFPEPADDPDLPQDPDDPFYDFDNSVTSEFREFAPFEADGVTPNSAAIQFNLDTESRTLNDGDDFYTLLNRGTYDLDEGFKDIGGVGPLQAGGVPSEDDDGELEQPFDAFRFEVFIDGPISDSNPLIVDVRYGSGTEPLTVYPGSEGSKIPAEGVIVDEDGRVTISTGATNINNPPIVSGPISETRSENASPFSIDLLQNASDPDGDTLDAINIVQNGTDDDSGITIDDTNNLLFVDPTAYSALESGQSVTVTYDFTVTDNNGGTVASSVSVTINGDTANLDPVVSGPVTITVSEDDPDTSINLLDNVTDPDTGDVLSVQAGSLTLVSGDASGITDNSQVDGTLGISPAIYNSLSATDTINVVYTYTVIDDRGGSVAHSATITINGVNDAPVVSGPISESRSENASSFSIDLLQNASDPDGDTLDAINIVQNGSDDDSGFTIDDTNNLLLVDPSAYSALESGQSVTVTYDYTVTDNNGGMVATSVSVTINGDTPNRDPVVSGPVTITVSEDDPDTSINLLDNVTDPDTGDVLTVQAGSLTLVSGDASGITDNSQVDGTLAISPAAYNSLSATDIVEVVYTYTVIDGEGGSAAHSATVTINGANDAPEVTGPLSETVSEDDDPTTVDLLTGASDPDTGDTVDFANLTLVSGDDSGIGLPDGDSLLSIDPSQYNYLAVNETATVIYNYDVIDGNQGVTAQSLTISITGANDAPTVGDAPMLTVTEDDASPATLDLLQGASDVDVNDTLSVDNLSQLPSGFSVTDGVLSFDPNLYNSLSAGEDEVVMLTYQVIDGNGGAVSQSATVTIDGVNDAPTVSGPISRTFAEDDPTTTISMLEGASDPDTNDTLSVQNVVITDDDQAAVSQSGTNLIVDPTAYGDLEDDEEVVITVTYEVTDGTASVSQTATITITGELDVPTVSGPIDVEFDEFDDATTVDLLAGASDPNDDPLSVINADFADGVSENDRRGVTIDATNNRLLVDPSAYSDLEDDESVTVVVEYEITDPDGNTVDQTATVTINGQTLVPSAISGELYVDHIENLEAVRNGATPIRNGVKDDDEEGLGGVTIRLLEVTDSGETEVDRVLTDAHGAYTFDNVAPGTYYIEYDVSESVFYTGSTRGQVVVGEAGGEVKSGPSLNAIGLVGAVHRLDLLVRTYVAAGIIDPIDYSNGLPGIKAELHSDGTQEMFVATEEWGDVFAEVTLNDARDAALLTIIDGNNEVRSARLEVGQFFVTKDGEGVQVVGRMEDFDFNETAEELLQSEFDDYRNAIDKVFSDDT